MSDAPEHTLRDVPLVPPDAIFGLLADYKACAAPHKVNLTIGAYRDGAGAPWVLPSVHAAEDALRAGGEPNKEYLPQLGDARFVHAAREILLGGELAAATAGRSASGQALSGTGALRLALDVLRVAGAQRVLLSRPTWGNHKKLLAAAGHEMAEYRYFDAATNALDLAGMLADLEAAPDACVVMLHACAHNPTGVDPTEAQWDQIADVMRRKRHLALFDVAYQGYVTGSAERDGSALRRYAARGGDVMACQSFSKIFGLYGERAGAVHVLVADDAQAAERAAAFRSQMARIARCTYSNPPCHGARIVAHIWHDEALRAQWIAELTLMAERIEAMRQALRKELEARDTGGRTWEHVTAQRGMFCYTGLSKAECATIVDEHAVFLTSAGRISIAGLNDSNVARVADAFAAAIKTHAAKY